MRGRLSALHRCLLLGALGLGAAGRTFAGEPVPAAASVTYELSFAGISFGGTRYEGTFGSTRYETRAAFETGGLVSVFWQAKIDASASGRFGSLGITPTVYDSFYRRGAKHTQRIKIRFGSGVPETAADPVYDTTTYPVTDAQKREAVDPMSALAVIGLGVTARPDAPCGTAAPVFDGRRRYDIAFTYLKDVPVKLPHGLFTGTAHLCQVHYRQIAGYKQKILEEGKKWPPIFATIAEMPDAGSPTGHYLIVLRLWAKTSWGTVEARLTERRTGAQAAAPN